MYFATALSNFKTFLIANQPSKADSNRTAAYILGTLFLVFLALSPQMAMAAPWDSTANQVLSMLTGGLTRTIAIIAVVALGIATMMGKLQFRWAAAVIVGIVLIFGSATIVDYFISAAI